MLSAGTINPARRLDLQDEVGSLEIGKQADLVATPASPIDNMENLEQVSFVMKGGTIVRHDP